MAQVLSYTIGMIVFNTLVYIIVGAFIMDDIYIMEAQNAFDSEINIVNASGDDVNPYSYRDTLGFFERFYLFFHNMPFWVGAIIAVFNTTFLIAIVLAWIRGV